MIGSPSYSKRTSSSTKTWPRKNSEKSVCAKRLALWTLALCFSPLLVFIGQINAKQRSELFFNSHHGVSPSPRKEHCVSCPLLAVKYPRPRVLFWFEPPKQVGDVPSLLQQPVQDATSTPIEQPMLGVGQQCIHLVVFIWSNCSLHIVNIQCNTVQKLSIFLLWSVSWSSFRQNDIFRRIACTRQYQPLPVSAFWRGPFIYIFQSTCIIVASWHGHYSWVVLNKNWFKFWLVFFTTISGEESPSVISSGAETLSISATVSISLMVSGGESPWENHENIWWNCPESCAEKLQGTSFCGHSNRTKI